MELLKSYIVGLKPDKLDVVLLVLIAWYLLDVFVPGVMPAELKGEFLNLKTTLTALLFKNLLPQHIEDIANRMK